MPGHLVGGVLPVLGKERLIHLLARELCVVPEIAIPHLDGHGHHRIGRRPATVKTGSEVEIAALVHEWIAREIAGDPGSRMAATRPPFAVFVRHRPSMSELVRSGERIGGERIINSEAGIGNLAYAILRAHKSAVLARAGFENVHSEMRALQFRRRMDDVEYFTRYVGGGVLWK